MDKENDLTHLVETTPLEAEDTTPDPPAKPKKKRVYTEEQRIRMRMQSKAYREANRDKIKAQRAPTRDARNAQSRAHYQANKVKAKAKRDSPEGRVKSREYREANRHRRRLYIKANADKIHAREVLRGYGITPEEHIDLYLKCGWACTLCDVLESDCITRLHIDHVHGTFGVVGVRGLLCSDCNLAIGKLGDTYEALQKAADYCKPWAHLDHIATAHKAKEAVKKAERKAKRDDKKAKDKA